MLFESEHINLNALIRITIFLLKFSLVLPCLPNPYALALSELHVTYHRPAIDFNQALNQAYCQ